MVESGKCGFGSHRAVLVRLFVFSVAQQVFAGGIQLPAKSRRTSPGDKGSSQGAASVEDTHASSSEQFKNKCGSLRKKRNKAAELFPICL